MKETERVLIYNLGENIIEKLADYIISNSNGSPCDFTRIACVFGGRRPGLFLRKDLAARLNKSFYPPYMFTIDEFMEYIIGRQPVKKIKELEAAYLVYKIVKKQAPYILKNRDSFSQFLPWAREINSFIEQLDLEDISDTRLLNIENSASIGYDVPQGINKLLEHIVNIRANYHKLLAEKNLFSRGRIYRDASSKVKERKFDDFDVVIFCNFFYLHKTELNVFKEMHSNKKGVFIFQGQACEWSVLKMCAKEMDISIKTDTKNDSKYKLSLYQGFDMHSQVALVREIVDKLANKEKTLILLPRPESLIPVLTEAAVKLDEFNVSMGYPVKRSPVYVLFDALFAAQENKKSDKYYVRDYLNLLRHPLVKNLKISDDYAVTRVIIHKIEELVRGDEKSLIGGSLFLSLSEIEAEEKIYTLSAKTLSNMGIDIEEAKCKEILQKIHDLFFRIWETADSFLSFSANLGNLLREFSDKSMISKFAFNLKVIEKIQLMQAEMESLSFNEEKFNPIEIWEIFRSRLESEAVSFSGSPLRGLQILGLFETRSLHFENVIVMDANESILPKLKIYEPLIPREVMINLGLNRLEKEEEIQRYQFNSIISGAKNVHLVYEKNQEKEKSRFIEELLWKMQKEEKSLEVINIPRAAFNITISADEFFAEKTGDMVDFLKTRKYSASRINSYLNCPMQFYYQYVLGLSKQDDLLDEPQASHIGTFIHELLEAAFMKFKGARPVIDRDFRKYFNACMDKKFEEELKPRMKSDSFLLKKIIEKRLMQFLDREIERDVERIICLEERREDSIEINGRKIDFVYTVDRIDEFKDKSIIIIDYKTGGSDVSPKRLQALELMKLDIESIRENIKSFQLPLYYYFVSKEFKERTVNAQIYNLRTLERKSFISDDELGQGRDMMKICLDALSVVLSEIFDPKVNFIPNKDERKCEFCSFRALCR
ncbi:MAG: PD-(D/E)XK nuclease family protein [Candidatus Omnitrophica bacterium]|jgi:RecB family exonuclease|nr:PD-(D/E)XK nuclease family protein [Candidatus Omnitrophota bacterium]